MRRNLLVLTGAAGIAGLLAFGSACDAECIDESCEPSAAELVDDTEPRPDSGVRACDSSARPSVFVYVARDRGNYLEATPVDQVWFEHEGETAPALCAMVDVDESEPCSIWIAGWEQVGRFRVFTQWCDVLVEEVVTVATTDDGCHPHTEFVILPASSRGCVTSVPGA
jgi:hypothetical protein